MTEVETVKVKMLIQFPRWYRNPIRWWRWTRQVRRHEKLMRTNPMPTHHMTEDGHITELPPRDKP